MNKAQRRRRKEKIQIQKDANEINRIKGLLAPYGYESDLLLGYRIAIHKTVRFGHNKNTPMVIRVLNMFYNVSIYDQYFAVGGFRERDARELFIVAYECSLERGF